MSPAVEEVENVTNKRHTQTAHHMYTRAGRQVKNFVVHTHIHTYTHSSFVRVVIAMRNH